MVSAHVFISGQVQGVGFRFFVKGYAKRLGLTGWVKNLPDGRVEAVFEGDKSTIVEMITWCRQGSPTAQVKEVTITWQKPQQHTSFIIRR